MSEDSDSRVKIGDLLDVLGVETTIGATDLVSDALVILKVVDAEGNVRLNHCWSEGMSWVERIGMLHVTTAMEMPSPGSPTADDGSGAP